MCAPINADKRTSIPVVEFRSGAPRDEGVLGSDLALVLAGHAGGHAAGRAEDDTVHHGAA